MIPPHCETELARSANGVISSVCQKRMGAMLRPPASEVDFICSLIENGVDMLDHKWKAILGPLGIHVSVAGVFCHQSPKVAILQKPSRSMPTLACELADLLVLHSHKTAKRIFWRGTLIQMKMYSGRPVPPDEPQFWLYDEWPSFSITAPGFDPRSRDFGRDTRSGQYGLVSNSEWKIMAPRSPLAAYPHLSLDFGTFLVRMLYDMDPAQPHRSSSHGRQVYYSSSKDWSNTVWEIVAVTGHMALRHMGKKKGLYSAALSSRLSGQVLSFLTPQRKFISILPPTGEELAPGPQGTSIFHISTIDGRD